MTDPGTGGNTAIEPPFWLTPCSYWQPAHHPVSAWLTHAPFAAWLIDALRPAEVVELGTHFGFSCFAFAEAAGRLGLDTRISAVDSWQGDDHAGFYGDEVYESVADIAARDYPRSVRLLRGWFSDARPQFADGSVDLLHIDGRHGYDDVSEDYTQWRSAVGDGGIVLFHDIAERDNDFGVWRLWEELAGSERTFQFHHGHGLGVLAVGEPQAGPLRDLFAADESTHDRIRHDFERLGEVVAEAATLRSLPAELERVTIELHAHAAEVFRLRDEVTDQDRRLADAQSHAADAEARISDLRMSTSWRATAPMRSISRFVRRRR